jgi:glycosyltransferase involved in cell wall biosynthesis
MRRLNILIWHIHGSYLNVLSRVNHNWFLPIKPDRGPGYGGRPTNHDVLPNMREVPAEQVRDLDLDLVIFQTPKNYHEDQHEILSEAQRRLPQIYLEHNTPRPHPTDTQHPVDDPRVLLVHVTHFNNLMWDNGRTPTVVIEHSVAIDPEARYDGRRAQGIALINGMQGRPRIAGLDLFLQAREQVALTCAGMQTEALGGYGDVPYRDLHRLAAEHRFLFSPMRYTSLPLAVIEGMHIGMPIVALATTEVPAAVRDGEMGYVSCDTAYLVEGMRHLLNDQDAARRMGARARAVARERFGIERFARDWNAAFARVLS